MSNAQQLLFRGSKQSPPTPTLRWALTNCKGFAHYQARCFCAPKTTHAAPSAEATTIGVAIQPQLTCNPQDDRKYAT
eukprot:3788407-Amphidinium_carterae.1